MRIFGGAFHRSPVVLLIAGLSLALAVPACAGGQAIRVLYNFCSQANCADGVSANGIIQDQAGNLYGTTFQGGNQNNRGVIFKMTPNRNGSYTYAVLYDFCALENCTDGAYPFSTPIMDTSGNLYGTAGGGGVDGGGVVYELTPNNGQWTETVLYNFCSQANCNDGEEPLAGLDYAGASSGALYDGTSPLYGTTDQGGTGQGGLAYSLQPGNGSWTEQVLYSFISPNGPVDTLAIDASGNLYGALTNGGKVVDYAGGIFELSPAGGSWTEKKVVNFCYKAACPRGASPWGTVYIDSSGRLWGTTSAGGALGCKAEPAGCGTLFKLTPGESGYMFQKIHDFCTADCSDGARPFSALQSDGQGNLFGTAYSAVGDGGSLFEVTGTTFKVLHTFCLDSCAEGYQPRGGLVFTGAGNLIGTTSAGRFNTYGTIYEITP